MLLAPATPLWNPDLIAKCWKFASTHHHGQSYGGAHAGEQINYLVHIGNVAMEVMWALQAEAQLGMLTANANLALPAAILHDTVEDTVVDHAMLVAEFGSEIANGVQALSKNQQLSKELQMADSLARILQQPREIAMVKMADRISNLAHPPFYWENAKILAYRDEAQVILDALGAACAPLAERLGQKIAHYPQFLRAEGA